jgi:predicted kinase
MSQKMLRASLRERTKPWYLLYSKYQSRGTMNLYIIRGLPNSGKSTIAKVLAPNYHYAADDWFEFRASSEGLTYAEAFAKYGQAEIGRAHAECKRHVEATLRNKSGDCAVANTFTTTREMKDYFELAETYGYRVHVITVERAHKGDNGHNVPDAVVEKMAGRWQHMDKRLR